MTERLFTVRAWCVRARCVRGGACGLRVACLSAYGEPGFSSQQREGEAVRGKREVWIKDLKNHLKMQCMRINDERVGEDR